MLTHNNGPLLLLAQTEPPFKQTQAARAQQPRRQTCILLQQEKYRGGWGGVGGASFNTSHWTHTHTLVKRAYTSSRCAATAETSRWISINLLKRHFYSEKKHKSLMEIPAFCFLNLKIRRHLISWWFFVTWGMYTVKCIYFPQVIQVCYTT